jgi:ankyrin repeat protein
MNTQLLKPTTQTPGTNATGRLAHRAPFSIFNLPFSIALAFCLCTPQLAKAANTNDITSLVQRGLFEEEANHNLDAAMQSYETAIKLHDKDRKLAATAIFRLGECYRKQGKTEQANTEYNRIVTEFPDQKQLVDLSRGYLPKNTTNHFQTQLQNIMTDAIGSDLERQHREVATETAKAEALWKHVQGLHDDDRVKFFTTIQPDQIMIDLVNKQFEASAKLQKLGTHLGAEHPEYKAQREIVKQLSQQSFDRAETLAWSIEQKYKMLKEQEETTLRKSLDDAVQYSKKRQNEAAVESPTTSEEDEQIRKIKGMIQNSPDLINVPLNGAEGTPLQSAAVQGYLKVAEFLLANGADLNVRTEQVSPPLICAAVHGHKAIVDLLLSKGADIEIQSTSNTRRQTALMCAANRGFKTILQSLVAHSANVNAVDSSGRTALHYAAERNFPEIAAYLLANKANVDAKTSENITPLHYASDLGNLDVAKVLVEHGANVNAKSDGGFTPLLDAAQNDHLDVAKFLLEHAANTEDAVSDNWGHADIRGFRPINFAIIRNDSKLLKVLLEHHADPNSRFTRELSPNTQHSVLPLLTTYNTDLVELLLKHDADPNLTDDAGDTSLHWAVRNRQKRFVELLIAHGANVNATNKAGIPPIAYVRGTTKGEADEIRQMLIKAGANENYARQRVISIWRNGNEQTLFTKDTNNWNHFTLMELISVIYGDNEPPHVGAQNNWQGVGVPTGNRVNFPVRARGGGSSVPAFSFPDFSHITISRLLKNGEKKEINADIRDMLGRSDTQKDIALEWGDIVEIPEQDHPVNKDWEGLSEPRQRQVMDALARNVEIRIKGSTTNLDLLPKMRDFQSTATLRKKMPAETRLPENALVTEFGLRSVINNSGLLRSSSDINHIKITRPTKKNMPNTIVVDLYNSDEPWISAGDLIEVPDRTTTTAQSSEPQ